LLVGKTRLLKWLLDRLKVCAWVRVRDRVRVRARARVRVRAKVRIRIRRG
jgi:hypothetical protein